MNDSEALSKAIKIASEAFEGKMDKGGAPYILHCLAVMDGVKHLGFKVMTAAVLHDLLEDCQEWTPAKLRDVGFCDDVANLVDRMTRREGEEYLEYIGAIANNPDAIEVKLADLRHNMDPSRLHDLSDKSMSRMRKYHTAYQFLLKYRSELYK